MFCTGIQGSGSNVRSPICRSLLVGYQQRMKAQSRHCRATVPLYTGHGHCWIESFAAVHTAASTLAEAGTLSPTGAAASDPFIEDAVAPRAAPCSAVLAPCSVVAATGSGADNAGLGAAADEYHLLCWQQQELLLPLPQRLLLLLSEHLQWQA